MNWILKNKNKKAKTLLVVLFLAASFLMTNVVEAAGPCKGFNLTDTKNSSGTFDDGKFLCTCSGGTKLDNNMGLCEGLKVASKTECTTFASGGTSGKPDYALCNFQGNGDPSAANTPNGGGTPIKNPNNPTGTGLKTLLPDNPFATAIKYVLIGVFNFCGWLFGIAATLFATVIDPKYVSDPQTGVLQNQAVKDVWIMVRDLLNLGFILVLLFAAFCTVFQIDSWNLKKVWLNILINALLVNFSFPIARFIIDISNVMFYYFANNLFNVTGTVTGSSIFANFLNGSQMAKLFTPENYSQYDIAYLVAIIVFTFVMGMTILIIAVLFVIRLVALAILVMFSPIGFVGYIFPGTRKYAGKWWDSLFSYAFFAPIMIFMINIAIRMMQVMGADNFSTFLSNATANAGSSTSADWIAHAALSIIPIVILWTGIGVAKSFGIAFADTVVKNGQAWGKTAGLWLAYKNPVGRGIKEGVKEKSKYNALNRWWKSDSRIEAAVRGGIVESGKVFGNKGFAEGVSSGWNKISDKDVSDKMKEYKEKNKTNDEIAKDLESKNRVDRMAATRSLMNEKGALNDPKRMLAALNIVGKDMALRNKIIDNAGDFAGNDSFTHVELEGVLNAATSGLVAGSPEAKAMAGKVKSLIRKENIKKLIEIEKKQAAGAKADYDIYKENLDKLDAEGFAKQKGLHDGVEPGAKFDSEFRKYVDNEVKTDKEFHQKIFEKMNKANRTKWAGQGLNP